MTRRLIALTLIFGFTSVYAAPADDLDCSQCVDKREIAPDSISTGKIANEAVTQGKIASRAVTAEKLKGSSVTQGKIRDAAVTSNKIRDGSITEAKLAPEMQTIISDMQAEIDELKDYVDLLQAYIEVDEETTPSRPVVRVVAANLQVVNGEGTTEFANGTGNIIVGYDEVDESAPNTCSYGEFVDQTTCEDGGETWGASHKTGSHNLVVGLGHSYSQYGGLVAGQSNVINFLHTSVTGGLNNIASGSWAHVSGGHSNYSAGYYSTVGGGEFNVAEGQFSNVSGGFSNQASGQSSSVGGGNGVAAPGNYDWAAGDLLETGVVE
jgi:hypothetical protein